MGSFRRGQPRLRTTLFPQPTRVGVPVLGGVAFCPFVSFRRPRCGNMFGRRGKLVVLLKKRIAWILGLKLVVSVISTLQAPVLGRWG